MDPQKKTGFVWNGKMVRWKNNTLLRIIVCYSCKMHWNYQCEAFKAKKGNLPNVSSSDQQKFQSNTTTIEENDWMILIMLLHAMAVLNLRINLAGLPPGLAILQHHHSAVQTWLADSGGLACNQVIFSHLTTFIQPPCEEKPGGDQKYILQLGRGNPVEHPDG